MFGVCPRRSKDHPKARFTTLKTLLNKEKPKPVAKTVMYGMIILLFLLVIFIIGKALL